MRPFRLVREMDGLTHEFSPQDGEAAWVRSDGAGWCRLTQWGWRVVDERGRDLAWPMVGGRDRGEEPPDGPWRSGKDRECYRYEMQWA